MPVVPHFRKLLLFVALSLADLGLTRFLLAQHGGGAYEWNPVASWWLAHFGWWGLTQFKLGVMLLSVISTWALSRHRPVAAGRVLAFGCVAVLAVIVRGGLLVPEVMEEAADNGKEEARLQVLDRQCAQLQVYTNLLADLRKDLVAHRRSLAEAVEMLSTSDKVRDPEWLRLTTLRFPGHKGSELLAVLLIDEAVESPEAGPHRAELYRYLDAEYRSCFGQPSPRPADCESTPTCAG